jgi:hypothetical protein
MMKLRKHTEWKRRTVDQTGRIILPPEYDAPDAMALRHVQLILPDSPQVAVAIGPTPQFTGTTMEDLKLYLENLQAKGDILGIDDVGSTPDDIADGRPFQWPEPQGGATYYGFHLAAGQWLAAMAIEGFAKVSMIVEYVDNGEHRR